MTAQPLDTPQIENRGCLVLCTVPDPVTAGRIAEAVIRKKLAACVSSWPLHSLFLWKGKIQSSEETMLLAKTSPKKEGALYRFLSSHHPYEVPEILSVPLRRIHSPYLLWLAHSIEPSLLAPGETTDPVRDQGARRVRGVSSRPRTRGRRHHP